MPAIGAGGYNRAVPVSRTIDRILSRLALVAVLLLVFAPSVSRVLAADSPQLLAGWSELCTTMGLKAVATPDSSSAAAGDPSPSMPGGDYCDYCPMAAPLPLLALLLALLWPVLSREPVRPPAAPRLRTLANLRGLGGQGPPLAL